MIEWQDPGAPAPHVGPCPNCGSTAPRPMVLRASLPSGDWVRLHACPDCGAQAFEGPMAGAYDDMPAGGTDALAFYLQQGANIGGMALRLIGLGRPAGTHYLEVGCGFGLSLDFARRILGWQVLGLDPSPFAVAGRDQLSLPIESRFLAADDLDRESADVIHASEFIEHIADPVAMLATLRQALRPGGTLLLTTPAAEMIRPDTGEGLLVPLLSAGWHLVIHTAGSLEWALRQAGFATVEVVRHGAQLVAVAGDLASGEHVVARREQYIEWLCQLAAVAPAGSDLGLGAMARLYREQVIAQSQDAELAWAALDAACAGRYGLSLAALIAGSPGGDDLATLTANEPLGLAGIALARGWQCRRAEQPAAPWFEGAIAAAGRLRAALRLVGADDADAEDVAHAAEAELIRLAAATGEPVAPRLAALRAAGGVRHAEVIAGDCFVTLVNLGALSAARHLADAARPILQRWTDPQHPATALPRGDASVLLCAALLELQQEDGEREEPIRWLARLRALALGSPDAITLYWPAAEAEAHGWRLLGQDATAESVLTAATKAGPPPPPASAQDVGGRFVRLVNSGSLDEASALRPGAHALIGDAPLTRAEASVMFCAATLELQLPEGDLEAATAWLGRLRQRILARPAIAGDLYWPALEAELLGWRQLGREDHLQGLSADAARAAPAAGLPARGRRPPAA